MKGKDRDTHTNTHIQIFLGVTLVLSCENYTTHKMCSTYHNFEQALFLWFFNYLYMTKYLMDTKKKACMHI